MKKELVMLAAPGSDPDLCTVHDTIHGALEYAAKKYGASTNEAERVICRNLLEGKTELTSRPTFFSTAKGRTSVRKVEKI